MSEILLTEKARHYLLAGNASGETITVTVSASEVNVFIRFEVPGQPVESNIIAQATTVDHQNYSILLKQIQHISEAEGVSDGKELAHKFLLRLDECLKLVEERRVSDNDSISQPLSHLRHGLKDLLDQLA
jgi:hypothetical protein